MKNKNFYNIVITLIAIILLVIVIFLIIDKRTSFITEEEALKIALQNASVVRENVTITATNKDREDRKYEFEFFDFLQTTFQAEKPARQIFGPSDLHDARQEFEFRKFLLV